MSLDQQRAVAAHAHVEAIGKLDAEAQKRYATVVYQTIALVRNAGLVQTLEFVAALMTGAKREASEKLLGHLASQLSRIDSDITGVDKLRDRARKAGLRDYMLLTRETMATLVWYRRFVQSVLKIDPANLDRDD
jgi:CRISPR/Cas system CMR-associated protein Cmr5 small subunit